MLKISPIDLPDDLELTLEELQIVTGLSYRQLCTRILVRLLSKPLMWKSWQEFLEMFPPVQGEKK